MSYIGSKPANKPVVASDLDPAVITGQTALTSSPADTDEFLISDAGVLKRLDASLIGGGGKILQVVHGSFATESSIANGETYTALSTSLDMVITPSATSSKILICYNFGVIDCDSDQGAVKIRFKIASGSYNDVTPIGASSHVNENKGHMGLNHWSANYNHQAGASITIVHSPSSTSALTYTPFFVNAGAGGDTFINRNERFTDASDPTAPTFFYAMEIGA